MKTGGITEEPEQPEEPRAGGFAGFILANRAAPDQGRTVGQVLARAAQARDREPEPYDDDDRQAALLTRGYSPGLINDLAQRLGDTVAELEAEREKIKKGERRQEIAAREHAAGRANVWQMQRMLDGDFGDPGTVERLERRADSIRRQIGEAQAMIAPPRQRDLDPVEAASRAAHETFREATRVAWEAAQGGSRPRRERPPFGSVSRGRSTEHTGPDCWVCAAARERDAARAREDAVAVYGEIAR